MNPPSIFSVETLSRKLYFETISLTMMVVSALHYAVCKKKKGPATIRALYTINFRWSYLDEKKSTKSSLRV